MSRAARPLLRLTSLDKETTAQLTPDGEAVLAGDDDAVRLNGVDAWLGGVHLRDKDPAWRWNGEKLVPTS